MAARWFYQISGEELGPITTAELVELARSGKLSPDDKVKKNDSKWVSASKVRGLFPDDQASFTLPENHYFVMGDHTCDSSDSRYWGSFPKENVIGKSFFVYWPFGKRFGWWGHD